MKSAFTTFKILDKYLEGRGFDSHRAHQFPRKILHMQTIAGEFTRNGYCVVRGLFTDSELDEMEAEFDRIAAQIQATDELTDGTWRGANVEKLKSKDDQVLHTHNVHRYSSVWLEAIQNPHFLDAVGEILGPDIVLNHTKLFLKPPEKGSPFPRRIPPPGLSSLTRRGRTGARNSRASTGRKDSSPTRSAEPRS